MKLAIVQLADQGIPKPGEFNYRTERFKDEAYDMTWNSESHAISIRCRKTGALRIVDQGACSYWDPKVEAKPEQKK